MGYNKRVRNRILEIESTIDALQEEKKKAMEKLQATCTHDVVLECDWQKLEYFSSLEPLRICLFCGLEEESYSLGKCFTKLSEDNVGEIREVPRDEIYRHRELQPLKTTIIT